MRIDYPDRFVFPEMLPKVSLPAEFSGALDWQRTYVDLTAVSEAGYLLIKKAIYSAASTPFDHRAELVAEAERQLVEATMRGQAARVLETAGKIAPERLAEYEAREAEKQSELDAIKAK